MTGAAPMTPCKPIIFSGPMVRAILAGTKTQTRRVLKRPTDHFHASYTHAEEFNGTVMWWDGIDLINGRMARIPYTVGTRLWVRERLRATGNNQVVYDADDSVHPDAEWVWKNWTLPSIHCPRGLSRITLEVTAVKVQRLQEISEDDAKAEGAQPQFASGWPSREHIGGFYKIWASIHGPDAWDANPWVAAYTFRRVMG